MMKKIAIVTDSSISFSKEEIKKFDLHVLPNRINYQDISYLDQLTIKNKEVNDLLLDSENVTTSPPKLNQIVEVFEDIKKENYDYTIILSLSKHISEGYQVFNQALEKTELKNYRLIDTFSGLGIAQQAVRSIRKMDENGKDIEIILNYLQFLSDNQTTYIYPKFLNCLNESNKVSKSKTTITSLFKIPTVFYLRKQENSIKRLGIGRRDQTIYDQIVKDFKKNKVIPKYYDLYLSENMAQDKVEEFKNYLFEEIGVFDYHVLSLSPVLASHTGPETLIVQWCPKISP